MLYITETLKSNPYLFHSKNTRALLRTSQRSNYIIYEVMVKLKDEINAKIKEILLDTKRKNEFSRYQNVNINTLNWDVSVFYQLLTASVRNHDRLILLNYLRNILVPILYKEGFKSYEINNAILETGKIVISLLLKEPDLKGMKQFVYDEISMTIQLSVDEVENAFEQFFKKPSISRMPHRADIQEKLQKLATFYDNDKKE
jgi:hypothetical protein